MPTFFSRQTLVNEVPAAKTELRGTVTSEMNSIRSQPRFGVGVRVTVPVAVRVGVRVGVRDGVNVKVGV